MCRGNGDKSGHSREATGRRVVPNLLSREIFKKVNFFKYMTEEEMQDLPLERQKSSRSSKVRSIDDNQHEQWNRKYASNRIKTTRYTWWNFVPLALFLQFTKVVNCFYVVNTILNSIPSISTNAPIYSGSVLALLILIGMLKEALADYKRYKTDKGSNATST